MAMKLSHPLITELWTSLSTFAITLYKFLKPDVHKTSYIQCVLCMHFM